METVLVIEDDVDLAETVRSLLEIDGFEVAVARDGRRGLAVLESRHVDVVVTDMMMPEMDGLAFLRAHLAASGVRAPVLAMSALEVYLDQASALGAAAVLRKPFSHDQLLGKVRALLRGARAGRPERKPLDVAAERRRVGLIEQLGLERPDFGKQLDPFVARVAATFEVSICLVSIIDDARQHWTSACGLTSELDLARGSPRADSFCTHAVEALGPLVVQDAADNPVFARNPLVVRVPFRFYAGVPILSLHGDAVGTLCLIDSAPRVFTHLDLRLLGLYAQCVAAEVRRRERMASPDAAAVVDEYADLVDAEVPVFARPAFVDLVDIESARRIERRQSLVIVLTEVVPGRLAAVVEREQAAFAAGWIGRLGGTRLATLVAGIDADAVSKKVAAAVGEDGTVSAIDVSGRVAHGFRILRDIGAL